MEKVQKENKMGTMPVNKLLLGMSVPMMLSMLVQALYNIVDSMFVARVNENALTAVSLAFPVQMLLIAVGVGTGAGVNAVLSKSLGERRQDKANQVAGNAIFLAVINYALFLIVGMLAVKPFFASQTSNQEIIEMGTAYLQICCMMSFGLFTQFTFERLLQSTGQTTYSMISQLVGAIINIILDPILIFGLLGLPKMGVAGAALATVVGQVVGGMVAIWLNLKKNKELQFKLDYCKPEKEIIKQIYQVGIPVTIMQAIGSVMTYGMNMILIGFTETATAVFGVYFKLQSFIFMPIFGLTNGMISIAAYNYGARKKDRLTGVVKCGVKYSIAIMLVGTILFLTIPRQLLMLFDASETMQTIGISALQIISLGFIFAGFNIAISGLFQALGNGVYSMVISIARQLVVILPVAFLLGKIGGLTVVWWSFPIAEGVALILSMVFLQQIYQKVIKHL